MCVCVCSHDLFSFLCTTYTVRAEQVGSYRTESNNICSVRCTLVDKILWITLTHKLLDVTTPEEKAPSFDFRQRLISKNNFQ